MRTTIDDKQLAKYKLTMEELLIALAIKRTKNLKETLDNMVSREILVFKDNKYMVTQRWCDEINNFLCDSTKGGFDDKELNKLAKDMWSAYPEGMMPGIHKFYRENPRAIASKLKIFFITYGEYPYKDVLEATKRFVASFNGNYQYLPLITNFIFNDKEVKGETLTVEKSLLVDFLENKETAPQVADDWMMNMRV